MQYGPHCQLLWIAAAIELRLQPGIIDSAHIHTNVSPDARGACVKASPGARHVGSFTDSKRVIMSGVRSAKFSHVTLAARIIFAGACVLPRKKERFCRIDFLS